MKLTQVQSTPESELILCCSRTHPGAKAIERVTALLERELDWENLIRLAFVHGVLPLVYSNIRKRWLEALPEIISHQLQKHFQANIQRNFFLTAELLKLLKAFEMHGLEAVPFKGPVLAASAYGDVTLRQFGDLDILVHRRDILEAGQLIVSQGYRPSLTGGDASDDHKPDPDDVAFVGPQYYTFNRLDGRSRVDLQWRISEQYFAFSLDEKPLWERLTAVSVAGRSVRTFAPMDMLLILCVHGSKHRWEKLKWVCDVAELVRAHKREIDWEKIQQQACKQGIQRMLRLGLFLAHELLEADLPDEILRQAFADATTKQLAQQIRKRLFTPADRPLGKFKRVIFLIRTKDHWLEGGKFCLRYISQYCRAVVAPTPVERKSLPLPMSLSFIYVFFRPLRLTVKYCWLGAIRICRWRTRGAGNLAS